MADTRLCFGKVLLLMIPKGQKDWPRELEGLESDRG